MHLIDQYAKYSSIIGKVPTPSGDVASQASKQWPEMATDIYENAKGPSIKADGAIIGQGVKKIPGIKGRPGKGLLLFWTTGHPNIVTGQSILLRCALTMLRQVSYSSTRVPQS